MSQEKLSKLKKFFRGWQAQERSFRIAFWVGIILIIGIIYLYHRLAPLATDTEFIAESDTHLVEAPGCLVFY